MVVLLRCVVRFVFVSQLNNGNWDVIPRKPAEIKTLPGEGFMLFQDKEVLLTENWREEENSEKWKGEVKHSFETVIENYLV